MAPNTALENQVSVPSHWITNYDEFLANIMIDQVVALILRRVAGDASVMVRPKLIRMPGDTSAIIWPNLRQVAGDTRVMI